MVGKIEVVLILDYHQTTCVINTEAASSDRAIFTDYKTSGIRPLNISVINVGPLLADYQSEASNFNWPISDYQSVASNFHWQKFNNRATK